MAATFDREFAEALCDLEIPQTIQFSPCGRRVLYSTCLTWDHAKGKNLVSTLWLAASGREGSSRQLTSGLFEDRHPRWLPDGKRVAFLSDRANAGKSSAIWILTVGEDGGGEPYAITPPSNAQRIETFSVSPDGASVAFVSADEKTAEEQQQEDDDDTGPNVWGEKWEHARLRVVDVQSKNVTTVVGGDRHVTNVCWSPDGKRMAFQSSQSPQTEEPSLTGQTISVMNGDGSDVKDLVTILNGDVDDLAWGADGKLRFITGCPTHLANGGMAAYELDPAADHPECVRTAGGVDNDASGLVIRRDQVVVSLLDRLDTVIQVVGESPLAKEPLLRKKTDIDAWDVFLDADGQCATVAAALSDVNHPIEVFTLTDGKLVQLSDHGNKFKGRNFGTYAEMTCSSSDGEVELDGIYLAPAGIELRGDKPKQPLPTFVMMHGGPADRNCQRFDGYYYMWAPYILSKGYGILLPQYRGSRGRGEKFVTYSIGGGGTCDYADVISITDSAISQGFADKSRLLVGGYSQGGFLTYLCSVRNGLHGLGWRFNAGVAGAGICDLDSLCGTSEEGSTFDVELSNGKVAWAVDPNDTTNRQGSALWEVAGAVRTAKEKGELVIPPMLILHGEQDVTCPFSQAEAFRRALRAHKLPCEFVGYPRQEHLMKEQKFWIDMLERIGRWCDEYIGPARRAT